MRRLIPFLLLFSFGTAHAALFADNDAREEIVKLRKYVKEDQEKRITELQSKLEASERARQALEKRLADMESAEKTRTVDLLTQMDRLNAELNNLRGQVEVGNHQIEQAQQRQRDLYADTDGRLRKLEGGAAPSGAAPQAPDAGTAPTAAPATDAAELKSYEAAHELFKAGKYKESAEAFDNFLAQYPSGKYASNAQYWLGYAHFSQKNYKAAISSQQKLLHEHPDSPKIPDALYNIANSQIQLGDLDAAKQTLRSLLENFPSSEVAPLAKKRLTVLESAKTK